MEHVFLRAAVPADYDACKKIANQPQNRKVLGFFMRVTFNDFAARQPADDRYILTVVEDAANNIVGVVRAKTRNDQSQTTVHEICVDDNHKGQGIGRLMVEHVASRARAHHAPKIFLKSPADTPAGRFYRHLGFEHSGYETPDAFNRLKRPLDHYELYV